MTCSNDIFASTEINPEYLVISSSENTVPTLASYSSSITMLGNSVITPAHNSSCSGLRLDVMLLTCPSNTLVIEETVQNVSYFPLRRALFAKGSCGTGMVENRFVTPTYTESRST